MDTILQRMDSFAKPLLASQGIQFHLRYDSSIRNLNLEMTKRKNFYLIFKEAVNNALKYSEARNLWVDISSESQYLVLTIKDDGKGFDTSNIKANTSATLGGNGLQNMQIRAKEADAAFQIESKAGEGTFIKLRMPIP
jgi:signal transduction histidine kinase